MAYPVLQSTATTVTGTDGSSITITKPTGLAEGDLMLAFISHENIGSGGSTISTPSGWTQLQQLNQNRIVLAGFYKVATSGDAAASNFTFNHSTTVENMAGSIHRIDGFPSGSIFAGSEIDGITTPATGTVSFTAATSPQVAESLILTAFAGYNTGTAPDGITTGSYTITPTVTFTEVADLTVDGGGDTAFVQAVARANNDGTTEITQYGATFDFVTNRAALGMLVIINAPQDAAGTVALKSNSPTFYAEVSGTGAEGTVDMIALTPFLYTQSGSGQQTPNWTNETKSETEWTNEDKSS